MPNYTTIISNPDSPDAETDVGKIGRAMAEMSEQKTDILSQSTDTVRTVDMNELKDLPDGSPGKQAAIAICEALAIAPVNGETKGNVVGRNDCPGVTGTNLAVKFVFEEEQSMIVVIPDTEVLLEYGLKNAPMKESTTYVGVVRRGIEDNLAAQISVHIDNFVSADIERTNLKAAIEKTINDNNLGLDPKDVFYQQLGAYSVRQCD